MTDSHRYSRIDDCRLIDLPHHYGDYGMLTVADEASALMPFKVERVYYIYDLPAATSRGGHSHYNEQRLLVAAAGCFDVTVDDGIATKIYTLRTPFKGLYIPAGIWRTVSDFSSGAVLLALCSNLYSEADYLRDYNDFRNITTEKLYR